MLLPLYNTAAQSFLITSLQRRDFCFPENNVLLNQGSLLLDYGHTHKERLHEKYLRSVFHH